ncbi:MAG: hypothetical protein IJO62_04380 [Clostridia bacterium]|nr:hypothetical protein [Clostridia bacterium]
MKYPAFKTANTHTLHIENFTQGLSLNEATHENSDGTLKECKNVWSENGILKSRPALETNINRQIRDSRYSDGYNYIRSMIDLEISVDGDIKHLALEQINLDISHFVCLTHFISSDGTVFKTAAIMFNRVTDDVFFIPEKINFFKGAPQNGSGIYAMAFTVNCENPTKTECRIYELTEDLNQWEQIYTPYIPTVLINGRGNKYELAKSTNQAFTGVPTRLEALNVLDPTFFSYFSTDGRSSSFRLPFSGLSNDRVVCRLYYTVDSFVQWIIEENETSACATLYNVEVTMHINREKGIVSFTVPAGEYEVPLITDRNENNLRITATKKCDYSALDIANATAFKNIDNRIFVGAKNKVFEANYRNPLYFSVDSVQTLGSQDSPVTAFAKLDKKIVAFKENKIYFIDVKNGEKLNGTSLLAETDREFWDTDKLDFTCVSLDTGCREQASVIEKNGIIYWLNPEHKIYSLEGTNKIKCLSPQLDIGNYSKTFGLTVGCYNLFFSDNKAFLINTKNNGWFYWEFPDNISFLGAWHFNGIPWLLCRNTLNDICFSANLTAINDTVLTEIESEITTLQSNVEVFIKTEKLSLGCDNFFKKLDSIIIRLRGNAKLRVNDRFETEIGSAKSDFESITVRTGICDTELVDIELSSLAPVSLGSIDIKYTSLRL